MDDFIQFAGSGIFALIGVLIGFLLNSWRDDKKEQIEKKKSVQLFISDLMALGQKIDSLMTTIYPQTQLGLVYTNMDSYYNQFNFDELTRFYDVNKERMCYFNGDTMMKVNNVYFHILSAKDYCENKKDIQKCYNELDWAIKGINSAIEALKGL